MNKTQVSSIGVVVIGVLLLIAALATFGINDNGYRTVVQLPSGTTFVKSTPGIYFDWFGSATVYPDVLTYDFENAETSTAAAGVQAIDGVSVRYQDGGVGSLYGVARFTLPTDHAEMLDLHRAFRTEQGVRDKIIIPVIKEALNLTAGLMTSEEAYAEKRNEYLAWSEDQVTSGKFPTTLTERTQIVEPEELDAEGNTIKAAVTRVQNIPVIRRDAEGEPMRGESPFLAYGIDVSGFQLTDWTFEQATLDQIQEKRAANMAIITSQANAAKANQQRLQAIAEGEMNVATAQYEQEVVKAEQVVIAERDAEVAAINAARQVEVNRQNYLAQVQDVLAAEQEALAIEARTTAEADARTRILEADNALAQKLETELAIQEVWAEAYAERAVPQYVFGGSSGDGGGTPVGADGEVKNFMQLMTIDAARRLNYERDVAE